MGPLTETRPKGLLPLGEDTIIENVLTAARQAGANKFILTVHSKENELRNLIGDSFNGIEVEYVIQPHPLGTADAAKRATSAVESENFAIVMGDCLYNESDLRALLSKRAAIGVDQVSDPTEYGVVSFRGDETVKDIIEKPENPSSNLVFAGAGVFPHSFEAYLREVERSTRDEYELTDAIRSFCEHNPTDIQQFNEWIDVGWPWDLLEANAAILSNIESINEGIVDSNAEIQGAMRIGDGAVVREGVVIEGPALIASGATIGPHAYLRGPVVVREDASVGNNCEVKRSVIGAGSTLSHHIYVGDSILGQDVNLGAGTKIANLRHDRDSITMKINGQLVDSGRMKLGSVIGDGAKTGVNTSLDVGVTLEPGETTIPGASINPRVD
jgi:bifunctional UDP-N-acetylglucosamine pyrophosphorylase/glucosamine-1-phosphate N-acetyltransferase